jgi:hypothetical protein
VDKSLSTVSSRRPNAPSGRSRRIAGLAAGLLLTTGMVSAAGNSPEASPRVHKGTAQASRGIRPFQSLSLINI